MFADSTMKISEGILHKVLLNDAFSESDCADIVRAAGKNGYVELKLVTIVNNIGNV